MEIYDRLRLVRESTELSQARFAAKFGIAQSTYGQWEIGKRSIPDEFKVKLSQIGVDLNWLITGKGSMYVNKPAGENAEEQPAQVEYKTSSGKSYDADLSNCGYTVPILATRVSAGGGLDWSSEDFREERMPAPEQFFLGYNKEDIFAAEVVGDSMKDIDLLDGDYVFAVGNLVKGDGIYVLALDTEVYVKRLEMDPLERKVRVISENEKYSDKIVEPDRVCILGKVIGWLHRNAN